MCAMVNPYTDNKLIKKPPIRAEPIDNVSIKIIGRERMNQETGSCFDTTLFETKKRPGDLTKKYATIRQTSDAFADEHITTKKPDPHSFLLRGVGTGGMAGTQAKELILEQNGPITVKQSKPPVAGARAARINPPNTQFRMFYERGDLPVYLQGAGKLSLKWKVNDIKLLDYHHYLPLFFDGLREIEHPYSTIAELGTIDLLEKGGAKRVLPVIPQLIIPIKNALNSRDAAVLVKTLRILRVLIEVDQPIPGEENEERTGLIGLSLVPYYRQLLPILNIFYSKNINIGDNIDYHQQKRDNIGDLIQDTLELFEQTGGEDAFINIKYLVPTYQSVLIN